MRLYAGVMIALVRRDTLKAGHNWPAHQQRTFYMPIAIKEAETLKEASEIAMQVCKRVFPSEVGFHYHRAQVIEVNSDDAWDGNVLIPSLSGGNSVSDPWVDNIENTLLEY